MGAGEVAISLSALQLEAEEAEAEEAAAVPAAAMERALAPAAQVAFEAAAGPVSAPEPPDEFVCPISQELMEDPVLASDGHAYERRAIERWFAKRLTRPKRGEPLETAALFPNHPLRRLIIEWREAH